MEEEEEEEEVAATPAVCFVSERRAEGSAGGPLSRPSTPSLHFLIVLLLLGKLLFLQWPARWVCLLSVLIHWMR